MRKVLFITTSIEAMHRDFTTIKNFGFSVFNISRSISNTRHFFRGDKSFHEMTFITPPPRIQALATANSDEFYSEYMDYLHHEMYIKFIEVILNKTNNEEPLAFVMTEDDMKLLYPTAVLAILSRFRITGIELDEFRSIMGKKLDNIDTSNLSSKDLKAMAIGLCYGKKAKKQFLEKNKEDNSKVIEKKEGGKEMSNDDKVVSAALNILDGRAVLSDLLTNDPGCIEVDEIMNSGIAAIEKAHIEDVNLNMETGLDGVTKGAIMSEELQSRNLVDETAMFNFDLSHIKIEREEGEVEVEEPVETGLYDDRERIVDGYEKSDLGVDEHELGRVPHMSYMELKIFIKKHKIKKPILLHFSAFKLKEIPFTTLRDFIESNFFILLNSTK